MRQNQTTSFYFICYHKIIKNKTTVQPQLNRIDKNRFVISKVLSIRIVKIKIMVHELCKLISSKPC